MSRSLFACGIKARHRRLLAMLEDYERANPAALRFMLAGILTAVDPDILKSLAEVTTEVLRNAIRRMPNDE